MALTKISSNVIANNTIAVGNIADNSVDATKIASNSILTRHIDDDQITTDQIAANTIATANIADNAVDGTKIASNSILTRHIDDNQIGIDQLNVSDGSNGQFLKTDGSGTMSFGTVSTTTALDDIATGDAASTLATSTGDITLDSPADIILDADGADIRLKHAGTEWGRFVDNSSNLLILAPIADKDIMFNGVDGSSEITALQLDMSEAGKATFNNGIISTAAAGQTQLQLTDSTNSKSAFLNYNNDTIEFSMNGPTERLRIYSNGNIAASGGIILGADLAQTAANLLDDYEEGTWTPTIGGWNNTTVKTAGSQNQGYYTKIGNLVTVTANIVWNGTETLSGGIIIRGLPFSSNGNGGYRAAGSIAGFTGVTASGSYTYFTLGIDAAKDYLYLINANASGYGHTPTISNSGAIYGITFSYNVS